MGNSFVYPAPRSSYAHCYDDPTLVYVSQKIETNFCGTLLCSEPRKSTTKIPCRYIQCQSRVTPYLIVFFHGNSEDIGEGLSHFLCQFTERFAMNIICPEYPSYGIYKKKDDSLTMDEAMMQDAKQLIKYCQTQLKYKLENIILIGRSLGTGIVAQLASEYQVRGTVMISPFTSIRDIAKHLVGGILSKVIPDVFRTIDYIDKVKSPVLFIHGEEDALIPPDMSCQLYEKTNADKALTINEEMTHNQFRLESDVFSPIHAFMVDKLELKQHLYSRRGKIMDSYIPRESTTFTQDYGEDFDGDFDGGFYEKKMGKSKSELISKAI